MSEEDIKLIPLHPFKAPKLDLCGNRINSLFTTDQWIFILTENGVRIYDHKQYQISSLSSNEHRDKPITVAERMLVLTEQSFTWLDGNCDQSLIMLAGEGNGRVVLEFHSIEKLLNNVMDSLVLRYSVNAQIGLNDFKFHPTNPLMFLMLINGTISLCTINKSKLIIIGSATNALCASWSPKGKQFAVALRTDFPQKFFIKQFDLEMVEKRLTELINVKNNFKVSHDVIPVDICWISTYNFIIAFRCDAVGMDGKRVFPCLYAQKSQKFTVLSDIYSSSDCINESGPDCRLYCTHLCDKNIVVLINNTAEDIAVYQYNENEIELLSNYCLPIEGSVIGLSSNHASNVCIPSKWSVDVGQSTIDRILFTQLNNGELCGYYLANSNDNNSSTTLTKELEKPVSNNVENEPVSSPISSSSVAAANKPLFNFASSTQTISTMISSKSPISFVNAMPKNNCLQSSTSNTVFSPSSRKSQSTVLSENTSIFAKNASLKTSNQMIIQGSASLISNENNSKNLFSVQSTKGNDNNNMISSASVSGTSLFSVNNSKNNLITTQSTSIAGSDRSVPAHNDGCISVRSTSDNQFTTSVAERVMKSSGADDLLFSNMYEHLMSSIDDIKAQTTHRITASQEFSKSSLVTQDYPQFLRQISEQSITLTNVASNCHSLLEKVANLSEDIKLGSDFTARSKVDIEASKRRRSVKVTPDPLLRKLSVDIAEKYEKVHKLLNDLDESLNLIETQHNDKLVKKPLPIKDIEQILIANVRRISFESSKVDLIKKFLKSSESFDEKSEISSQRIPIKMNIKQDLSKSEAEAELYSLLCKRNVKKSKLSTVNHTKTHHKDAENGKISSKVSMSSIDSVMTTEKKSSPKQSQSESFNNVRRNLVDKDEYQKGKISDAKPSCSGDTSLLNSSSKSKHSPLFSFGKGTRESTQASNISMNKSFSTDSSFTKSDLSKKVMGNSNENQQPEKLHPSSTLLHSTNTFSFSSGTGLSLGGENVPTSIGSEGIVKTTSTMIDSVVFNQQSIPSTIRLEGKTTPVTTPATVSFSSLNQNPILSTSPVTKSSLFSTPFMSSTNSPKIDATVSTNIFGSAVSNEQSILPSIWSESQSNTSTSTVNVSSFTQGSILTSPLVSKSSLFSTPIMSSSNSPKVETNVSTNISKSPTTAFSPIIQNLLNSSSQSTTQPVTDPSVSPAKLDGKITTAPSVLNNFLSSPSQSTGLFSSVAKTSTSNLFANTTQSNGGLFDNKSPISQSSVLFPNDTPTLSTASSVFTSSQSTNLFGSSTYTAPSSSGDIFTVKSSTSSQSNSTSSTNIFATSSGLFGSPSPSRGPFNTAQSSINTVQSGSPSTAVGGLLGSSNSPNENIQKTKFVASSSPFTSIQLSSPTVSNAFVQNGQSSSSSLFSVKSPQTTNLFPQTSNQQRRSPSLFNSSANSSSPSGLFTSTSQSSSLFGASSNLFGQSTQSSSGLFASKPAGGGGLFPSDTSQTLFTTDQTSSQSHAIFGSKQQTPGSSLFSSQNIVSQSSTGQGLFGSSNTSTSGGLFNNSVSNNDVFGGTFMSGLGGQSNNASGNVFGTSATNNQITGGSSNLFVKPATQAGGSSGLFNNSTGNNSTLFGSPSSTVPKQSSLFGSAPTFGSNSGSSSGGLFNSSSNSSGLFGNVSRGTNLFSTQTQTGSSLFGGQSASNQMSFSDASTVSSNVFSGSNRDTLFPSNSLTGSSFTQRRM